MTAAVPDPRFRDQLAEARRAPWVYSEANGWVYGPDPDHAGLRYPYVYAADPEQCRILVARLNADAAEVEAHVQAAAVPADTDDSREQNTEPCPKCRGTGRCPWRCFDCSGTGRRVVYPAAALASPAPAPDAES